MRVESLKLINFRNYEKMDMDFPAECSIIYGDNAQGKTNILEAIYLCATGRSHRTSKDYDLVKMNSTGYRVSVVVQKIEDETSITLDYGVEGKKNIRINEIPARKIGELIGKLKAVMFSPEDLMIVKEGPSERRRFLDITISQLKPYFFHDLQQYNKIITQRNFLLKEMQKRKSLTDTLEVWDENLVKTGARIIKTRKEFADKISVYAQKYHFEISNGKENLNIKYQSSFKITNWEDVKTIENDFRKAIHSVREKEILKGTTLFGPQRDDCEIKLNDTDLRVYGSQGQQRTAVLSMKLSEIGIMYEETGEYPVLLLDDVMSELDPVRQQYLLNNIKNVQTFVTSTERGNFKSLAENSIRYYHVQKGTIREVT